MKRLLFILLAGTLCLSALTACGKEDSGATEGSDAVQTVPVERAMYDPVALWEEISAWDMTYTFVKTCVEDGDEENSSGVFTTFEGKMIPGEAGNLYGGDFTLMNSAFAFPFPYECYHYDGWSYQIYEDEDVPESNEYLRYEEPEESFRENMGGLNLVVATEEEFLAGSAARSEEGVVMVTVPVTDEKTLSALSGEVALIAEQYELDPETLQAENAAISYAIQDGVLVEYIAGYNVTLRTDGKELVYTVEHLAVINQTGEAVEAFTLPEGAEDYEILTYEE